MGTISRFPFGPKRGQLFLEVFFEDRVIAAAAKKGAPTSRCATQLEQAVHLQFEEVRLGESASARFGMDAQNAVDVWLLTLQKTTGHLKIQMRTSRLTSHRGRLGGLFVYIASQRQCQNKRRGHQRSAPCVDNTGLSSEYPLTCTLISEPFFTQKRSVFDCSGHTQGHTSNIKGHTKGHTRHFTCHTPTIYRSHAQNYRSHPPK